MTYNLFLDDIRLPEHVTYIPFPILNYIIVRSFDEFKKCIIERGIPQFVAFDHDLAVEHYEVMQQECDHKFTTKVDGLDVTFDYGTEKTGYDAAKWLVDVCSERNITFPDYIVHSMNPVGKERIINYIENAKKHLNI